MLFLRVLTNTCVREQTLKTFDSLRCDTGSYQSNFVQRNITPNSHSHLLQNTNNPIIEINPDPNCTGKHTVFDPEMVLSIEVSEPKTIDPRIKP